jgi:hypothetical protein
MTHNQKPAAKPRKGTEFDDHAAHFERVPEGIAAHMMFGIATRAAVCALLTAAVKARAAQ